MNENTRMPGKFWLLLWILSIFLFSPASKADEEKVLNIYNWSDYIADTTLENFDKEFGIRINYDTYDSSGMVDAKLLAERTPIWARLKTGL